MLNNGIKVRIIDTNGSFISFRYMSSNARSRVKKASFIEDLEKGIYDVENPEKLENI